MIVDDAVPVCSRAGCRAPASWRIDWRNPRIHAPDRVKSWTACEEHRAFLSEYLSARNFPVASVPLDPDAESAT
ncbi:hypothetical protein Q9S36_13660 [Microbacterium sp. ARD31]|jgi:hypothetical protein|uniref:hypothetical protein n=1 Tax=unclassified Microbacterium TaxID=2609290 RepID=UPI00204152CB|nr:MULTISPECIES: hypothetical protein [unclassified Microbacterium]MDT0181233.1 hypothetical protein [Microbacterium sp. ARD31]